MLRLVFMVLVPNLIRGKESKLCCAGPSQPAPVLFHCPHPTPTSATFFSCGFCLPLILPLKIPFSFCPPVSIPSPCYCFSSVPPCIWVYGVFLFQGIAWVPARWEMGLTEQRGTISLMSAPFLMSQGLLALRRSNLKSYTAPASLKWRVFNADRVFKNLGARLQLASTNSVKTGLLKLINWNNFGHYFT